MASRLTTLLLLLLPLRLQGQGDGGVVLQLQPGMRSVDVVSAPRGANSTTAFNLRFATRIHTATRWITPVIGGSVAPYGTSDANDRSGNASQLFAGLIFPAVDARRTGGWATVEVPLLVYHTYGGGGENNRRLFGRDLFAQVAVYLHVGEKVLRSLGPTWARLDVYGFVEQNLTPNRDRITGKMDRFNPVILYGVSLPVGGSSEGGR